MSFQIPILFPPPPSLFMTAISLISITSLSSIGISEIMGKHLQYSKFWNVNPKAKDGFKLSSRAGMLLLYTPALAASLASFAVPCPGEARLRCLLVSSALGAHFFKRVFEVLFVHRYSGQMILDSAITISFSYFISTVSIVYAQHLSSGMPEPQLDLKFLGVVLFLVGIGGNFYHHYLLSKLRAKDDKGYKIPKGGLFGLVICPHYLFEIIDLFGIAFISQTLYSFSFAFGSMFYLMGRSYATKRWYLSKFENFPRDVKALVPFIF